MKHSPPPLMRKLLSKKAYMGGLLLLFILPLSTLLYIEISEINRWLEFTRKERMGVEYNRSLRKLLEEMMNHRGMTIAYLSGDPSFKDTAATEHSRIKEDISETDLLNKRYGALLMTDGKWGEFKKLWNEREGMGHTSPKESFERHTALIAEILSLMSYVGENSNLILDPELSSYYLMDSITFKLPALAENIGQARGRGVGIAVSGTMSSDEKREFIPLSGVIRSSYAGVVERSGKVLSSKPDIGPQMTGYLGELNTGVEGFLDMLDKEIINTPEISIRPAAYYEAASRGVDAVSKLYDMESSALDSLLQARMSEDMTEKYMFISVSALISVIFVYLFAALNRNLSELEKDEDILRSRAGSERDLREYIKSILDSQEDMVIITDGKGLRYANKSLLDFIGYEDLEQFQRRHGCICDLFVKEEGFLYKDCDRCPEIAVTGKAEGFKVKMFDAERSEERVFLANSRKFPVEENQWLISFRDITTIEKESRRLEYLSITDPLTRIYNRLKFDTDLEREIQRSNRYGCRFSLVMFDIDHFKAINDTFGHKAGDDTLKGIARMVSRHIRGSDIFARWGGEEFMILLTEVDAGGAVLLAEKLRTEIESSDFQDIGKITCSFGITEFIEKDDIAKIIERVDEALYGAKKSGRNSVCVR